MGFRQVAIISVMVSSLFLMAFTSAGAAAPDWQSLTSRQNSQRSAMGMLVARALRLRCVQEHATHLELALEPDVQLDYQVCVGSTPLQQAFIQRLGLDYLTFHSPTVSFTASSISPQIDLQTVSVLLNGEGTLVTSTGQYTCTFVLHSQDDGTHVNFGTDGVSYPSPCYYRDGGFQNGPGDFIRVY